MNEQQDGGYPMMDRGNGWDNQQGGHENSTYPPQEPYPGEDLHHGYQDYPHGSSPDGQPQPQPQQGGGYEDDVGPQITADIDR